MSLHITKLPQRPVINSFSSQITSTDEPKRDSTLTGVTTHILREIGSFHSASTDASYSTGIGSYYDVGAENPDGTIILHQDTLTIEVEGEEGKLYDMGSMPADPDDPDGGNIYVLPDDDGTGIVISTSRPLRSVLPPPAPSIESLRRLSSLETSWDGTAGSHASLAGTDSPANLLIRDQTDLIAEKRQTRLASGDMFRILASATPKIAENGIVSIRLVAHYERLTSGGIIVEGSPEDKFCKKFAEMTSEVHANEIPGSREKRHLVAELLQLAGDDILDDVVTEKKPAAYMKALAAPSRKELEVIIGSTRSIGITISDADKKQWEEELPQLAQALFFSNIEPGESSRDFASRALKAAHFLEKCADACAAQRGNEIASLLQDARDQKLASTAPTKDAIKAFSQKHSYFFTPSEPTTSLQMPGTSTLRHQPRPISRAVSTSTMSRESGSLSQENWALGSFSSGRSTVSTTSRTSSQGIAKQRAFSTAQLQRITSLFPIGTSGITPELQGRFVQSLMTTLSKLTSDQFEHVFSDIIPNPKRGETEDMPQTRIKLYNHLEAIDSTREDARAARISHEDIFGPLVTPRSARPSGVSLSEADPTTDRLYERPVSVGDPDEDTGNYDNLGGPGEPDGAGDNHEGIYSRALDSAGIYDRAHVVEDEDAVNADPAYAIYALAQRTEVHEPGDSTDVELSKGIYDLGDEDGLSGHNDEFDSVVLSPIPDPVTNAEPVEVKVEETRHEKMQRIILASYGDGQDSEILKGLKEHMEIQHGGVLARPQ